VVVVVGHERAGGVWWWLGGWLGMRERVVVVVVWLWEVVKGEGVGCGVEW
jgi:hypothetical protein